MKPRSFRFAGWSFAIAGAGLVIAVSAFLILPLVVIVASSIGEDAFLRFPPTGFTLSWYERMLELEQFIGPLGVSLRLAAIVALLSALAGSLAAYAIARAPRLRSAGLENLFILPIILPSLVVGLALLVFFNLIGITNPWLTLVFGHVAVTLPIVLQTSASLVGILDRNLEDAAMTLGARPATVTRKIVLPLLRPAIIGGLVMAFALSFDEFVISILLAHGGVITFPVQLFQYMRFSVNPTVAAISTVLIGATCLIVFALQRAIGLDVLFGLKRRS
jgi:putative spermidine/putrescine transport system permease protein